MLESVIVIMSLVVCFVPVLIAFYRKHNKLLFINCLIMVGGFTMSMLADVNTTLAVGQMIFLWVIALVWSLTKNTEGE